MEYVKPKKVFVVDDDAMLTESLSDYLTRKVSHKVSSFHTGEDCLQNITDDVDVVVLDFYLNSVNKEAATGLEIVQIIKKNYPQIHIIMLSSQERYGLALQTIQKGAEHYIIKDEEAYSKILQIVNEI